MKTTIDIPDDLYRQVKARSALAGKRVRDVTIELYRRWLAQDPDAGGEDAQTWLSDWLQRADQAFQQAPLAPSAREVLEQDRNRFPE